MTEGAPRVAVVGGGLAGISAALACADAGAQVTLFEKRSRLGGLTWSFSHDGLTMDNGQHVFLRCCTAYLGFLDRIGSTGDVALQERLDVNVFRPRVDSNDLTSTDNPAPRIWHRRIWQRRIWRQRARSSPNRGVGVRTARPGRPEARPAPAPLHLGRSLLGYRLLPLGARLRLGLAAVPLARLDLNDPALDEQTFASWLAQHGQGEAAVSALWDLICLPTVNLPAREASLSMAAKVFQTGLLTDSGAGDIGWSRVPLGLLHGERAASALSQAGVHIRLGESVVAIERAQAEQVGANSDPLFEVHAANGKMAADGVVVALPHYCTEEVLPEGVLPGNVRPSRLASSPIVNVHVHFDRRVTELPFLAGLDTEAQWVFDRTASSGASTGQYLAVSISAAESYIGTRPEDLVPQVVASLRALLPAARPAQVLSSFVTKEHQATFRATPGSAAHRAATRTRALGSYLPGRGLPPDGHQPWKAQSAAGSMRPAPCSSRPGCATPCRHPRSQPAPVNEPARVRYSRSDRGWSPRWPRTAATASNRPGTGEWSHSGARQTRGGRVRPTTAVVDVLERARDETQPQMRDAVARLTPSIRDVVSYHLGWTDADGNPTAVKGGKGIRAALATLSAEASWADASVGAPGGVAVELVHNFSLLHDDLMDGDVERRHRPTAWSLWGPSVALLAGDALSTLATDVLLRNPNPAAPAATLALSEATAEMIAGQADDLAFEARRSVSVEECMGMSTAKTGALLGCAASIGAILAGAPLATVRALRDFGRHLGVAFQATDDLLGIWGDPATTGKPIGNDIRQRKKSMPIVAALAAGDDEAKELDALLFDARPASAQPARRRRTAGPAVLGRPTAPTSAPPARWPYRTGHRRC